MTLLVMSSDNNIDTFELFYYCLEKNWPNHPEVIYSTETLGNPCYKTICRDYPLKNWSKRIRETVEEIDDKYILLMCDDIFIRKPVNNEYVLSLTNYIDNGFACLHFEQSFLKEDDKQPFNNDWCKCTSWLRRSLMCCLWDKEKLLRRLDADLDPWALEGLENTESWPHLISKGKDVFDWGKGGTGHRNWGVFRGKWSIETVKYAEKNGIKLNMSRGIQYRMPDYNDNKNWSQKLNKIRS